MYMCECEGSKVMVERVAPPVELHEIRKFLSRN